MTTDPKPRKRQKLKIASLIAIAAVVGLWAFVKMNPLIFNESLLGHAHCISQAGLGLLEYADRNGGQFPTHTNGFGDAVLPLTVPGTEYQFTGPMFDSSEFVAARIAGRDVNESKLGRIYVQGLTETNNPLIALLFDQLATPGGDHCHVPFRLYAPLGREVWWLGSSHEFVKATAWYSFATNQIELLVAAGVERKTAQKYYEMTGLKFEK